MSLEALAAKYGTDKLEHGYIPFYEQNLPKDPKRILEIGVKEGRSLGMWAEYFPDAEIYGLDLFEENEIGYVRAFIDMHIEESRQHTVLVKGNQCDYLLLEQLRKLDFDVIIDDGSHNSRDQLMTFFGLFNGKHYFIEDLHCNYEDFYSQGLPMQYCATGIFKEMANGNDGTNYVDDIVFGHVQLIDPYKIVCIKNTQE